MPEEIILIAAVTVDGFIARHNNEITNWTKDLKLFKKQTLGHTVIVGSNTYDTLSKDLPGRKIIKYSRTKDPTQILMSIREKRCFVIGGGKTYSKFSSFLTHLSITPHPYVFNKGVRLFDLRINELKLKFESLNSFDKKEGIFQYQYKVIKS